MTDVVVVLPGITGSDPTWLAYTLYGNPAATVSTQPPTPTPEPL